MQNATGGTEGGDGVTTAIGEKEEFLPGGLTEAAGKAWQREQVVEAGGGAKQSLGKHHYSRMKGRE